MNAWLDAHGSVYDVFVQFDIDHAPHLDYLEHVLGYFRDPGVGWVQAPSVYGNLSNWVARGSAEQELVLQGPLQQGFYGVSQTPFIIGSHTSYRTAAVLEIGGFQPTRAEDHLDSLLLATRGYRGVFVPEVIATGAGPETFDTYLQQQFAWAMSLVQVLLGCAPRQVGQLGLKRAAQFLFAESWYPLSSLALLTMSLIPIVALLSHRQPANVGLLPFLLRWVPIGVVSTTIWIWTRRWHMPPGLQLSWRGVVLYVARWPIVLWAVINAVLGIRRPYMITRKGSASSDRRVEIIRLLQGQGARIKAYDPQAMQAARDLLPGVEFCADAEAVAVDADAVILLTQWDEFRKLDLASLRATMRRPVLIDGRNLYDPRQAVELGFSYRSIGRTNRRSFIERRLQPALQHTLASIRQAA